MSDKTTILIDGENLLVRYEAMIANGATPKSDTIHKPGVFVWTHEITKMFLYDLIRVSLYTTFVGDERAILDINNEIASLQYKFTTPSGVRGSGSVNPHVYKKERKSVKTKSVDINISIDALRHVYNRDVDKVFIISGDGDYIPLIQEIMRQGISVSIGALSDGCHPALEHIPDDFYNLDEIFFE